MPQSAELAGGAGFTYEGDVAAYYLAAMLSEAYAPGIADRAVISVAVQRRDFGEPLDDVIVDLADRNGELARLSLQVKQTLRISDAASNADFRDIIRDSQSTLAKQDFRHGVDRYGAAVGTINETKLRAVNELAALAQASTSASDFERRFAADGNAPVNVRPVYEDIVALLNEINGGPCTAEYVHRFLSHFILIKFDFIHGGGTNPPEAMNRIRDALEPSEIANAPLVWSRLVEWARAGAGRSEMFDRTSIIRRLAPLVRLRGSSSMRADLDKLRDLARSYANDIQDDVGGTRLDRDALVAKLDDELSKGRLIQIRGLAGCGKSVLLRNSVERALERGSTLFLKADQIEGKSWIAFAAANGLSSVPLKRLLIEVGATGTPTFFIDAIDRIEKDHQAVVLDVLREIVRSPELENWKIIVALRDAGIEQLRNWLSEILDTVRTRTIVVEELSDDEANSLASAKPHLHPLLFGPTAVRRIVRRPFFAKVLNQSYIADPAGPPFRPQSEMDLIENWWKRGGYDATGQNAIDRQRAIIDLARVRATQMSLPISLGKLASTGQISNLRDDGILQDARPGHSVRFAHDIFFEWSFYAALVEREADWIDEIRSAGEPPAVARVVELLSQAQYVEGDVWQQSLAATSAADIRPQWMRAWLMGPPTAPAFETERARFEAAVFADDFSLLRKVLVWFQAEKTTPNAGILASDLPADRRQRIADILGHPTDFQAWRRLIEFLLERIGTIPVRLYPDIVSIFEVWQNYAYAVDNPTSAAFLNQCAAWMTELDQLALEKGPSALSARWEVLPDSSDFKTSLVRLILKSSSSAPEHTTAFLQRRIEHDELRRDKRFTEVVMFSQYLAKTHAKLLVDLTLAKLREELPDDKVERERREAKEIASRRAAALAKPEAERTRSDQLALAPGRRSWVDPVSHHDWRHLALHESYEPFSPPSPLREPFHSLFQSSPDEALRLLRELSNHAITAWRQLHRHDYESGGTPVPLDLKFPWGAQQFWGTVREYLWCRGMWAPDPVAAGYLALENWAFGQLEAGFPLDALVERIVTGHECIAILGTAIALDLHTEDVSEAILPLIGSQRLWWADHNRMVQDLSNGMAALIGFTGRDETLHIEAIKAMSARPIRQKQLRWIAPRYVFAAKDIAKRARAAIRRFKNDLPYEYEEWRNSKEARAQLRKQAIEYSEVADPKNYKFYRVEENPNAVMIVPESPSAKAPENVAKVEKANLSLREGSLWIRASKAFEEGQLPENYDINGAIELAKRLDSETLFTDAPQSEEEDTQIGTRRGAVASTAAVVLAFREGRSEDELSWARGILKRASKAPDGHDLLWSSQALISWHEGIFVARGLAADLRARTASTEAGPELLELVGHPLEVVSLAALEEIARLWPYDAKLVWSAFYIAFALCHIQPRPEGEMRGPGDAIHSPAEVRTVVDQALAGYLDGSGWRDLPEAPPAWIKVDKTMRGARRGDIDDDYDEMDVEKPEEFWAPGDRYWYPQYAAKVLALFPTKQAMESGVRDIFLTFIDKALAYTNAKNAPPWVKKGRRDRSSSQHWEWTFELAHTLGRVAGVMPLIEFKPRYLDPILALEEENLFKLLNPLADLFVKAYVLDAAEIPDDAVPLLELFLDRLLAERVFDPSSYRPGEFSGNDLYPLSRTLLFVAVERAGGAARYVNGDWSEIEIVMPIIDRFIRKAGFAGSVMLLFLTLCERAKASYPAETFADQVLAILQDQSRPLKKWHGSFIPARIAELVQHFADRDTPVPLLVAQKFLRILDMLVDMGDRRSAALQLGEAFREVRIGS